MQTVYNRNRQLLATCRNLKVTYSQFIRLIDHLEIGSVELVHPDLQTIFKIDLDEFIEVGEYYQDFIYYVEVTNHLWLDNSHRHGYSLDLEMTREI